MKRARTATDAGDMTFEAAEPFLAAMKQGELVEWYELKEVAATLE